MILKEEEKKSLTFDYLDGFEIIDDTFRLFIIEGIGNGAMQRYFLNYLWKDSSKKFKGKKQTRNFKIIKVSDKFKIMRNN